MKKRLLTIFTVLALAFSTSQSQAIVEGKDIEVTPELIKQYKDVTLSFNVIRALEMLKDTQGEYSRQAILGKNLTKRPIKVEFTNLAQFRPDFADFDALGWKQKGRLYIYINEKHKDAPVEALSAVLAHEAVHQDDENSINEETYAWTLEATVWTQLTQENPALEKISHQLVERENVIKTLFLRGNKTSKNIHTFVLSNQGYRNLPERSSGFEVLRD